MSFAQESGYTPNSVETLMDLVRQNVNTQFNTSYTQESFVGTNYYKYFYALIQKLQQQEVKTSEIFAYLQTYITQMNERISRPVTTPQGLIDKFETEGYRISIKPPLEADAGKLFVCVDLDDGEHAEGEIEITSYAALVSGTDDAIQVGAVNFVAQAGAATPGAATFQAATSDEATAASLALQINSHASTQNVVRARAFGALVLVTAKHGGVAGNSLALIYDENDAVVGATVSGATLLGGTDNPGYEDERLTVCTLLKNSVVGGIVTMGEEEETIVLTNGQSFDYKFYLPERIEVLLRLTITLSENNQLLVGDPDETKQLLLDNINARYKLGKNFEPQRYFSLSDAPWAESVLLEYALPIDGSPVYTSAVYDADFDELFDIKLENTSLVEA